MSATIYLTGDLNDNIEDIVVRKLGGHKINVVTPVQTRTNINTTFEILHSKMKEIILSDLRTIRNSADILLVRYNSNTLRECSVHNEMVFSCYFNVPVIIWLDGISRKNLPLWDIGCIDYLSFDLDKVITYCIDLLIRNGKIKQ